MFEMGTCIIYSLGAPIRKGKSFLRLNDDSQINVVYYYLNKTIIVVNLIS